MKGNLYIAAIMLIICISQAAAQDVLESFDGDISVGYRWISPAGSARSGEYEYFQKSDVLFAVTEWDRLPHRFMLEYHSLNERDFFKALDYSFGDIVVFNAVSRRLHHNLDHYSFGTDDASTPSQSFTDSDPLAVYATQNTFNTLFLRLKTPDFPLHVYAEARGIEKEGMVQQRFLRGYFGDINKVSLSRGIDWRSREGRVGVNSHLGPVEMDYNHTEIRFDAGGEKVLYDDYNDAGNPPVRRSDTYPHNLVPDLESSSDTIRMHTSYTGRIVAAGTYTTGEKENRDSGARTGYWNAAGDLTLMPIKGLAIFFKYRHYDLNAENPDRVTMTGQTSTYVYNVRDSISSRKDVMSGAVRYRATERMTIKGEYSVEKTERRVGIDSATMPLDVPDTTGRTTPAYWEVAPETKKTTARLSATYRIMKRLSLHADYSHMEVDDPAYNLDPDEADAARLSLSWMPSLKITALACYSGVREKRGRLGPPLAGGERQASRDQALGGVTVLLGNRSSITTTYAYFRNQADHTITYNIGADTVVPTIEPGIPYDDIAHVGSLFLTHAISDATTITAEAARSYSRGAFRNSGGVQYTTGIAEFSDLSIVEDIFAAGIETALDKGIVAGLRYQYRKYNDRIEDANDGKTQIWLASMSVKW